MVFINFLLIKKLYLFEKTMHVNYFLESFLVYLINNLQYVIKIFVFIFKLVKQNFSYDHRVV